jgi:hypothetical protein
VCRQHPNLIHLGAGEIVRLTDETSLIGHRGCCISFGPASGYCAWRSS